MIRRVGIVSKPGREDIPPLVTKLLAWLDQQGVAAEYDVVTAGHLGREGGFRREELPEGFDLLVVLGGDGTLLSAARAVGERETPILAVNLGGLGFMMTTGPDELLPHLERVLAGDYSVESRSVLQAEIMRGNESVETYHALNDVVINKAAVARLLELDGFVDGEFVCSYRADGLVLSTPTGSTAYSLSAGGPVILPSVSAISVTPICPHTLTNRPVLVSEGSKVEVVLRRGEDAYLTVDGQVGIALHQLDRIRARRADHSVKVIQPQRVRFFEVLRSKMKWGEG